MGLGKTQAQGVRNGLDPRSLPSVGAPGRALEDKASPSLGEGWEEETGGPSYPTPIQVLMSSSRDLESCGKNREAGGPPGYRPTWCLEPSRLPNLRQPGR